ncbi:MAG: hypothetical protein ILO36_05470 [Abditibacteriota bacterium]|nr:hypothetical protein [Abditibacteriota bacterium]
MNKIKDIVFKKPGAEETALKGLSLINLVGADNAWGKSSVAQIVDCFYFGENKKDSPRTYLDYYRGSAVVEDSEINFTDKRYFSQSGRLGTKKADGNKYRFDIRAFTAGNNEECAEEFLVMARGGERLPKRPESKALMMSEKKDEAKEIMKLDGELDKNSQIDEALGILENAKNGFREELDKLSELEDEQKRLTAWKSYFEALAEAAALQAQADAFPKEVKDFKGSDPEKAQELLSGINGAEKQKTEWVSELSRIPEPGVDFGRENDPGSRIKSLIEDCRAYKQYETDFSRQAETLRKKRDALPLADISGEAKEEDLQGLEALAKEYRAYQAEKKAAEDLLKAAEADLAEEQKQPDYSGLELPYSPAVFAAGLILALAGICAALFLNLYAGLLLIAAGFVFALFSPAPGSAERNKRLCAGFLENKRKNAVSRLETRLNERKRSAEGIKEPEPRTVNGMEIKGAIANVTEFRARTLADYNSALREYEERKEAKSGLEERIRKGFAAFGISEFQQDYLTEALSLDTQFDNYNKRKDLSDKIDGAVEEINEKTKLLEGLFSKYGMSSNDCNESIAGLGHLKNKHDDYALVSDELTKKQAVCEDRKRDCKGAEPSGMEEAERQLDKLSAELAGAEEKKNELHKKIAAKENEIKAMKENSSAEMIAKRDRLLEKYKNAEGVTAAVNTVKDLLITAIEDHFSQQPESLLEPASGLMRDITGDGTSEIVLRDNVLALRQQDGVKSFEELSDGTKAQLILAYRLANIGKTEGSGSFRFPLIMDEALAECDREKTGAICKAVLKKARDDGRQVFFFTCKKEEFNSIKECFEACGAGEDEFKSYGFFKKEAV